METVREESHQRTIKDSAVQRPEVCVHVCVCVCDWAEKLCSYVDELEEEAGLSALTEKSTFR